MPFDATREAGLLAKKIKALKSKSHIPQDLVGLVEAVYSRQIAARSEAAVDIPGPEALASASRQEQGQPMLVRESFPVDIALAKRLCGEFATLLRQAGGPSAQAADLAMQALDSGAPHFEDAVKAYQRGDETPFAAFARLAPDAPRTLSFLVQSSLMPSLQAVSLALVPQWEDERTWYYGHCPACGSPPLIGSLEGKEGRRFLWCSFCGCFYRVQRLPCPICMETESGKLPYYVADEEPGFRVNCCTTCNNYIKTVDFRDFDRASLPLLDDLESIALDTLAARKGFTRPALSGWGF